jgi:hypothetical protein
VTTPKKLSGNGLAVRVFKPPSRVERTFDKHNVVIAFNAKNYCTLKHCGCPMISHQCRSLFDLDE